MNNTAKPMVFAIIPVFNRLHFTRKCIHHLMLQSHKPLRIIVADGGSTDGTVEAISAEYPDVTMLPTTRELWWAGAMAMGIHYALKESKGSDDYVLMMNNDTQIPPNYIDQLLLAAQSNDAAVGALIVDSRDATRILDAGEYINWETYSFPLKDHIQFNERFCDDVDVLPGRGSLVSLRMIRMAGNVDANMFPHYLADYEFFYRLKRQGFRLGVCYETSILAHIEETGIIPSIGMTGFRSIWRETFSRRSMSNVIDHWRFVERHAPAPYRTAIHRRLIKRVIVDFTLRTPIRPLFLPLYWLISLPYRVIAIFEGQKNTFSLFFQSIRKHGVNVLCNPQNFPGLIRWPLYFLAAPGPISNTELAQLGFTVTQLVSQGVLRTLRVDGWYALETLNFSDKHEASRLKRLFWMAWNPFHKLSNTLAWRRDLLKKVDP